MDWVLGILLCGFTIVIHFEWMQWLRTWVPRFAHKRRRRMLIAVLLLFVAHSAEVYLFAGGYYVGEHVLELGELAGHLTGSFRDYIYLSAVSYTTVGFGDVHPVGELRAIAAFEGLVGLLMIAWSAAFTVFFLERRWVEEEELRTNGE